MKRQHPKPTTRPAPKSLKVLLRGFRKTYCDLGKALRAGALDQSKAEAESRHDTAREAMIEAPVVGLEDIATKLRFYFEVEVEDADYEPAEYEWGRRTLKCILRDIEKPKDASSLRELRKECVATFRASHQADKVADEEKFRVYDLLPCPDSIRLDWEYQGEKVSRPLSEDELQAAGDNGQLSPVEVESRIAELRTWQASRAALEAQHPKIRELKEAAKAADDRWLKVDDQFIEAPAQTLEDIGVKLEFLTVIGDMKDGPDADVSDRMVFSLIRDIERMTGTKILR